MKILKIFFASIILILLGCPLPTRPIWFKYNDKWVDKIHLSKDGINLIIEGHYYQEQFGYEDRIAIIVKVQPEIELSPNDFNIVSNGFEFDSERTESISNGLLIIGLKAKKYAFSKMSSTEYANYIDSIYLKVLAFNIFKESFSFEVNYERDWQKERFDKIKIWKKNG